MDEPRTWTQAQIDALIDAKVKARRFSANDISSFIAAAGTVLVSLLTVWAGREAIYTGGLAREVKDRQIAHEQKTQEVKVALDAEKASVDRKLERIEKQTDAVVNKIQVIKP